MHVEEFKLDKKDKNHKQRTNQTIAVEVSLNTLWVLKILAKGITSIMLTSKTSANG